MAIRTLTPWQPIGKTILPGLIIMFVTVVVAVVLLALNSDVSIDFPYLFLLPWILALSVILVLPSLFFYFQGNFSFENPLIFATYGSFLPAFVIGGIALSTGLSQPYFLNFIQDAEVNLPFTIQLIMLGFGGLALGYVLPVGVKIGEMIERVLPTAHFEVRSYEIPGLLLLGFGIINSVLSLVLGLFGFQRGGEIGTYDGLLFLTTLFWLQGSFLLWFIIFKTRTFDIRSYFIIGTLVTTSIIKTLFEGSKGGLLHIFIIVFLAYLLAGREFRFKQIGWASAILVAALIFGTIYGTTFRTLKGSEGQVAIGEYTGNVLSTVNQIGKNDNSIMISAGFYTLAERIDTVSSLAVVVSNYEALAPYEESYGLDDNITKDLMTFLIPRFIWNDKPVASEARKYSELYFNYGENSFAITPMGDLLRNFGVIGVPIGMLVLGVLLRILYRALIEDQPRTLWRATIYFMLLTAVSYEGFYGSIIPYVFKVGTTAVIGMIAVTFLAKQFRQQTSSAF